MPLSINGKVFLNIQEAVAWLLASNALPFQCKVNYVADTEIAKSNIINPSPAEIKIGSLVLFADGKVGTVSGITANGFMVGAESTDLSDGVPHITNIALDAYNHLIFTMSEGSPIDAGLVKMVSSLIINASQHLIVNYNDGTSADLGAIFQGNVNVAGNLTADSIVENMSGYSAVLQTISGLTMENVYTGVVKNGNKITFVTALKITRTATLLGSESPVIFTIPADVAAKLYPVDVAGYSSLAFDALGVFETANRNNQTLFAFISKAGNQVIVNLQYDTINNLVLNAEYYLRYEKTFLLSDNLM